jgi:hypothetical protein
MPPPQRSSGRGAVRTVWNGLIDKHPAVIVRCTGVAEVLAAVEFARAQHLLVAGGIGPALQIPFGVAARWPAKIPGYNCSRGQGNGLLGEDSNL